MGLAAPRIAAGSCSAANKRAVCSEKRAQRDARLRAASATLLCIRVVAPIAENGYESMCASAAGGSSRGRHLRPAQTAPNRALHHSTQRPAPPYALVLRVNYNNKTALKAAIPCVQSVDEVSAGMQLLCVAVCHGVHGAQLEQCCPEFKRRQASFPGLPRRRLPNSGCPSAGPLGIICKTRPFHSLRSNRLARHRTVVLHTSVGPGRTGTHASH